MTKPQFDAFSPLPGSDDAPVITAEQMSRFLYNHIGSDAGKQIAKLLNSTTTPDVYGALQVTHVPPAYNHGFPVGATAYYCGSDKHNREWWGEPIRILQAAWLRGEMINQPGRTAAFGEDELTLDITKATKAPTKFLPIDRPVRVKDLEPGDVLRFCYEDNGIAPHGGYAVLGSEVVFKRVSTGGDIVYRCTNGQGNIVEDQHCPAKLFSFVRLPFKAGEAVRYKAEATKAMGWGGALLVGTNEADRPEGYGIAVINHKGVYGSISATDLERIL